MMGSFSISPRAPYPVPTQPFSGGVQVQVNGVAVGPPGPTIINFVGANYNASYDPVTGTVTIADGTG
jgi:hypothetical protein